MYFIEFPSRYVPLLQPVVPVETRQTFEGASPGFPVNLFGFAELHAAFLNESRTRGIC
jgi:hypothetical protein